MRWRFLAHLEGTYGGTGRLASNADLPIGEVEDFYNDSKENVGYRQQHLRVRTRLAGPLSDSEKRDLESLGNISTTFNLSHIIEVPPDLVAEGLRRQFEGSANGFSLLVKLPGRCGGNSDRSPNG